MASEQKSTFGISQLGNETPMWAKNIFRVWFFAGKAIVGYIAATKLVPPNVQYEITQAVLLLIDPIVFGISKMFGVVPEQEEK